MANNKVQEALRLAGSTALEVTGSYQTWTGFLATAGRLYNDVCCKG